MKIFDYFRNLFSKKQSTVKASDTGLFDPYLPITSLDKINDTFNDEYIGSNEGFSDQHQVKKAFLGFKAVVIILASILAFRLIYLQISQGRANYSLAEGNRLKTLSIPAPRGLIYDRNGTSLVSNTPNFSVVFHSSDWPKTTQDQTNLVNSIASILQSDPNTVRNTIKNNLTKDTITLKDNINRNDALVLELKFNNLTGIEVIDSPTRTYSDLADIGHFIGYTGLVTQDDLNNNPSLLSTSYVGKAGLEKTYDDKLQGVNGIETLEVDSLGRTVRSVGEQPPVVGDSLYLNVDGPLQSTTASALEDTIQKNKATSGAAVAMDVKTGGILAMVSMPTFDNNLFSDPAKSADRTSVLNDPLSPLINRAIAGQYPSGSTIKPVVATAALQENVITPTTLVDTSAGQITVGGVTFHDNAIHGITEVTQAIAVSNNVFFWALGGGYKNVQGLGVDRLDKWLDKFGFGNKTGIDIPGEASGLVPSPAWKQKTKGQPWFIGDTYNMSIGQGDFLTTPLQLTRAISAIANGGTLYEPHLVKSIVSSNGQVEDVNPVVDQDHIADASTLDTVRQGMRRAVESGSAHSFANLPIQVAAKTGTAQFDIAREKTHSWFTAFAPYDDPQIAVSVIVEGGGEGYDVAARAARNMIEEYFHLPLTPIVAAPENQ